MPAPTQLEHSKSIKQALLMQRQSEVLSKGERRLPRDVAQTFHANDMKAGYWFNPDGTPREKQER